MGDILTIIGESKVLTGATIVISLCASIIALGRFVTRAISLIKEKSHGKITNYIGRIDQTAHFASTDPAYLDALFRLKSSRLVSLFIVGGACIVTRGIVKDGALAMFGVGPHGANLVAQMFSGLALMIACVCVITLFEISRIARVAVDHKDRIYFPDRFK